MAQLIVVFTSVEQQHLDSVELLGKVKFHFHSVQHLVKERVDKGEGLVLRLGIRFTTLFKPRLQIFLAKRRNGKMTSIGSIAMRRLEQ